MVITVTLIVAHIIGWQEAEIRPDVLVQKLPDIGRFLSQVTQPDIIFYDQQYIQVLELKVNGVAEPPVNTQPTQVTAEAIPIIVTGIGKEDVAQDQEPFKVELTASVDAVSPGQMVVVSGKGFRPDSGGDLIWQSTGTNASAQNLGSFKTGPDGSFQAEIQVPSDLDRVVGNVYNSANTIAIRQIWNVGSPHFSDTLGYVLDKTIETIFLALMGTSFAVILSMPLSFLASRNLMPHNIIGTGVYAISRTVLNILRSIEVVILAIIFAATVGLGSFAGVLALTVHSIASLGKLYSEAIESIDKGPIEAITATGANRLQVIMFAVVPQFIPQFLSFTLYRWDINVRMATIIGIVGGGGIGLFLAETINKLQWNQAATGLWVIALVVIAIDWISSKIRAAVV
jgi:phosphonate transport system permease protein